MDTKTLSPAALAVIDGYLHFSVGNATASVPYFNNKTVRARASLRARIGKGSVDDIREELESALIRQHIRRDSLTSESLAKLLADSGLGLDCSAFAYYILDAESRSRGLGHINKRITFTNRRSPLGKMFSYLRPVENCDVKALASDLNSRIVPLSDVQPGDMITMLGNGEAAANATNKERDHILVVSAVARGGGDSGARTRISYAHAIAYPEDGLYRTGVKQGEIEAVSSTGALVDQVWRESGSLESARAIFERARASKTELRRLKWL